MSKPELLVPIGLPASGKTTLSKAWQADDPDARIRVSWDELRVGMFGENWIFNRKEEEQMKAQARRIVFDALRAGLSVVVDNTNLSKHVRASWKAVADEHNANYIEHDVPTSLEECIHRDRRRDGAARVGQAVIDSMAMYHGYLDWDLCECYEAPGCRHEPNMKPIAIVDIDGTIADCGERLHHIKPTEIIHKMGCTVRCDCGNKDDGPPVGHPMACPI